ncbi:unnamed protein product [Heligmosomoides polygyrus]|uniref:Uncharacterized protein n=1 Tax=Heligmosomoides polygyrus TaxID=6339 RepID=A0A183FTP4_HELPZ|nr:unnamed protein product [Heligmosomoides polygyrus]
MCSNCERARGNCKKRHGVWKLMKTVRSSSLQRTLEETYGDDPMTGPGLEEAESKGQDEAVEEIVDLTSSHLYDGGTIVTTYASVIAPKETR